MTVIKASITVPQRIRAVFWFRTSELQGEDNQYISGGGMDSMRRFGLRVSSSQAFLCAFSRCLEYLSCWSSWMSRVPTVWELSILLVGGLAGCWGQSLGRELRWTCNGAGASRGPWQSGPHFPPPSLHFSLPPSLLLFLPFISVPLRSARCYAIVELRV